MGAITWLFSNWKTVLAAGVTAVIIGTVAFEVGKWMGYSDGKTAAINKAIGEDVGIRTEQNETRNLRPDTRSLLDGMRGGAF